MNYKDRFAFLALQLAFLTLPVEMSGRNIVLHDGWILNGKYKATVPSTVMGVLTTNGEYANILEGMDYQKIDKSRFDAPWWFRKSFQLSSGDLSGHVFLQLDGISYRANIILNGHCVADSAKVFGTYRRFCFDVTDIAQENNLLEIQVFRAKKGEPNAGYVDWNPRPADESMGIIRPVTIITTEQVGIQNLSVSSRVNSNTLKEAWLEVNATVTNFSNKKISGLLQGKSEGIDFSYPITLAVGETKDITLSSKDMPALHVRNPRLWWVRNMGKANLYHLNLRFISNGKCEASANTLFGIREIGSYYTSNGDRGFTLNGRRVLIRGGGWTDDIFMRDTPDSYWQQLNYVCDMNLNAIRMENIWGNSQDVFNMCDSLGIMVLPGWSCHWEWEEYLGTPCDELYGGMTSKKDISLLTEYFKDQILWLRSHPSIICWFVGSDKLPAPTIENNYRMLLEDIDPSRPYITSAKKLESTISGTAGMKMNGPYDYVSPAYWYSREAPGGAYGFNTETGIGAQLPQKESLVRMLGKNIWPISKVWDYHCTASESSMGKLDKLQDVIKQRYGQANDLNDFTKKAELANYESTKAMFESFRVRRPNATGVIQWMLNSARPSLYWQLYDHYLVPNSSYYSVKDGNQPIQLIYDYGKNKIMLTNETLESSAVTAEMACYNLEGSKVVDTVKNVTTEADNIQEIFTVPQFKGNMFLFLKLTDKQGRIFHNYYVLSSEMDKYDWDKSDWITTPISEYADYKALEDMKTSNVKASLQHETKGDVDELHITLENNSDVVSFFLRMVLKDKQGQIVVPAYYSDNFVSIPPKGNVEITCEVPHNQFSKVKQLLVEGWNKKAQVYTIK